MGLFSSKTIYTVSSVAYNIAGDAAERQNFLKQSLVYLNAADQSIGEKLPRMYLKSLGVKIKRAYKHAAMLPQGLPTASQQLWDYQDFEDAVQDLLDDEYGPGRFMVLDTVLTVSNTAPAIENYLNRKYGWDSVTGLMTMPPTGFTSTAQLIWYADIGERGSRTQGYTIEFRHLAITVPADLTVSVTLDAVNDLNLSQLNALVSEWVQTTRSDLTVSRAFLVGDVAGTVVTPTTVTVGSRVTETTTTVITTTDGVTTTIRTKIVDATTSETITKTYKLGTGEFPTLDAVWLNSAEADFSYFPSIPFRIDNKDVFAENLEGTADYKARKKVVGLMGMDALSIRDMILDNPNVNDIDFAFMQAGANMNTESQAEMDYLFRFWEMCIGQQTTTQATHAGWEAITAALRPKPPTNSLTIRDGASGSGAYNITIEWDWVKKVTVTGTISPTAKIGSLAIVAGTNTVFEFTTRTTRSSMDSTVINIRKQISETQYEEIQISGAIHKNDVYKGKTVETLASKSRSAPADNEGFIIPLHMGLFGDMPLTKRTQLAQECIYMVFNTYVKTKQKWYQTGIFKILLAILAIVVMVFFPPAGFAAGAVIWGSATLIGLGLSALLANIIMSLVIGYLVSYLMGKWAAGFESVFGKKWAAVVQAIVSIVVMAYAGGQFGTSAGWLKTAVQIIDVASQLFSAYVKGATAVMAGEFDAFMDKAEEDKKALDKLSSEFFGDNDLVSIDYLLQLQKTLREDSPTTFLSRTLLTGSDVVDITLGQVSEMASMTLAPRLQGIFV